MSMYMNNGHSQLATPIRAFAQNELETNRIVKLSIFSNSSLLREGILSILAQYIEFCVVGCYSGDTIVSPLLPNPSNHVVLLDDQIGFTTAIRRVQECRALETPPKIVVLEIGVDDIDRILAYIEAGVHGYIVQGASAANVATTIENAQSGLASCSPRVTARLFARLAARPKQEEVIIDAPATSTPLTARETQILQLIGDGYTNKQIGEALRIEVCTVKYHIHNILDKLQLPYRRDAARYARDQGWLGQIGA